MRSKGPMIYHGLTQNITMCYRWMETFENLDVDKVTKCKKLPQTLY